MLVQKDDVSELFSTRKKEAISQAIIEILVANGLTYHRACNVLNHTKDILGNFSLYRPQNLGQDASE